jgi:protocatechuate 3,4-dioxygenase alpha subunit
LLSAIADRGRVPTLMARAEGAGVYRFDVHIQGPRETIFFDI